MIIYKATNKINGKVYIGQTVRSLTRRKSKHIYEANNGCNHYFARTLQKYGAENFKWEVICICPNIDSLNEQEEYYIAYYNSMDRDVGYNLKSGGLNNLYSEESKKKIRDNHINSKGENNGMFGKHHSEGTKRKISESRKGVKLSKEHKQKLRNHHPRISGKKHWNYGKRCSEETIQKMSKAHSGKNNPMFGKHHTEESNKKNRQAHLGKKHTKEHKQKISDNHVGMLGKHHSENSKKQMSDAKKGGKCVLFGKHHSEETKRKMRRSAKKHWTKIREEKNATQK